MPVQQPLEVTIFKFVSVRPPQRLNGGVPVARFARYLGSTRTDLEVQFQALNGAERARERARGLAEQYLNSPGYIAHPQQRSQNVQLIHQLAQAISEGQAEGESDAEITRRLEDVLGVTIPQYVQSDSFHAIERRLWEAMYAQAMAPLAHPDDRGDLVTGIRLANLLRGLGQSSASHQAGPIADYLEATIVLPEDLFPKPSAVTAKPGDPPVRPPTGLDRSPEHVIQRIERIIAAATDIRRAGRRQLVGISDGNTNHPSRADTPIIDLTPVPAVQSHNERRPSAIRGSLTGPIQKEMISPWRLNATLIAWLPNSTKEVIAEYGLSLEAQSFPEILDGLEEEVRRLTALTTSTGRAITRVGNSYLASPGLVDPQSGLPGIPQPTGVGLLPGTTTRLRAMVGDLMTVGQQLLRYEEGEVAHIENVMQTESRERKHRRLQKTENVLLVETERTEQNERDLQTTERFEMQNESQQTIQSDASFKAGVTVTAGFGPVEVHSYADFATQSSQTQANRTASDYARDVTDRTLARVIDRVREERTHRTLEEVEELNTHGFSNTGPEHVVGIYRWVDKVYRAQLVNHGPRFMIEFTVPEPAAFYIYAETNRPPEGVSLTRPEPPQVIFVYGSGGSATAVQEALVTPMQVQSYNYLALVGQYNVEGVNPPPQESIVVGTAVEMAWTQQTFDVPFTKVHKELAIPDGYRAREAWVRAIKSYYQNSGELTAIIGTVLHSGGGPSLYQMNGEEKVLPITVHDIGQASVMNVEVRCERKPEHFEAWQVATFNAIVSAYEKQKAAYEDQVKAAAIAQGVVIAGRNPARNREIEREELKKACVTMISGERYDSFNAVSPGVTAQPGQAAAYPEIDIGEATTEGRRIQFFEQAFEWEHMTYLFYPYFWGSKNDWLSVRRIEDTDPLFTKFLQAGAARVLVPVRIPYNEIVLNYLSIDPPPDDPWNGGDVPIAGNPLYLSLAEELRAQTGGSPDGTPVGEPWEVRVPTSLVILQEGGDLPEWPA